MTIERPESTQIDGYTYHCTKGTSKVTGGMLTKYMSIQAKKTILKIDQLYYTILLVNWSVLSAVSQQLQWRITHKAHAARALGLRKAGVSDSLGASSSKTKIKFVLSVNMESFKIIIVSTF